MTWELLLCALARLPWQKKPIREPEPEPSSTVPLIPTLVTAIICWALPACYLLLKKRSSERACTSCTDEKAASSLQSLVPHSLVAEAASNYMPHHFLATHSPKPIARDTAKSLDFFIFGHPCGMSPSPEIHNVGFAETGFKHRYHRFDAEDVRLVMQKVRLPSTGGGSVTIPHKESVLPEMDVLSDSAKRIGAVNTITKLSDGARYNNSDYTLARPVHARIPQTHAPPSRRSQVRCMVITRIGLVSRINSKSGCRRVVYHPRGLAGSLSCAAQVAQPRQRHTPLSGWDALM